MTHEDANINIEVANASRDLAEAAKQGGSSMKTIALFSMPSLGWDDPRKFALYFAFTIPVTLAIFGIWAGITQRGAIKEMLFGSGQRSEKGADKRV